MNPLSADLATLREDCDAALEALVAAWETVQRRDSDLPEPAILAGALQQLCELLARIEAEGTTQRGPERGAALPDISELGDYAFALFGDLITWSRRLLNTELEAGFEQQSLTLALWFARHGAELRGLEIIVNACANLANRLSEPAALEALCAAMGELMNATAPTIQQDIDNTNPGRPWRILNLNRGIVATRTHNPATMENAFRTLVVHLPEDAPAFFREGMAQMTALNYPAQVHEVMERYYRQWSLIRNLH
jgi:hypothetical protein